MFGNIFIFNKKKVEQYSALMGNKMDLNANSNVDIATSALLKCSEFEELLKGRDDYVDFDDNPNNLSIQDVKISSIIKFAGEIYVPEEFDMIHLIEEFKPLVISSCNCNSTEEELLNAVFSNSKMKIPIYCELGSACDFWMGIGKISPNDLLIEYNDLEDYEGTEVKVIAKLESRKYHKDKPLPVYNIYKDFLGLNRTLRKHIDTNINQKFESIDVEEDYMGLEILAVYC